jgi:protein ImuB
MFCCLLTSPSDVALAVARACSPRLRVYGPGAVFDVSGCARTIGPPVTIGWEVSALAHRWSDLPESPAVQEARTPVRVSVAPTVTMAWMLAHACTQLTVIASTAEAKVFSRLPVGWLGSLAELEGPGVKPTIPSVLAIFERWGLRTLADVAALPRRDVLARFGPLGERLHQAACGEDAAPFVPMEEPTTFTDRLELDWPIEGLEPLAFVLSRLCERLSLALQRADRGAVTIRTHLRLSTRDAHERILNLPSPMADPRILRTLILLDLESHPPPAAIDVVTIDLDVSPGPIAQGSLIAPTLPTREDLATLLSRLTALVGASRVGAPRVLNTHDARAVGMGTFTSPEPGNGHRTEQGSEPAGTTSEHPMSKHEGRVALRRFRLPIAARVEVDHRVPVQVTPSARGLSGGRVVACAGPCRSSGGWWTFNRAAWDRDEWDVELTTGDVYRIARDRATGQWVVEAILD